MRHPIFARVYARISARAEDAGNREHREQTLQGLSGLVCEVGAGNGLNFGHYPPAVTRVVAVEPESHLRRLAQRAASTAPVPVDVVDGTAERLPLADQTMDVVVMSLVLCSVDDQRAALAEALRVLRPGGELRFYEHVVAADAKLAARQRLADRLIWPRLSGGCHSARNTLAAIERSGFVVAQPVRRFTFSPLPGLPTAPHVIGSAHKPLHGESAAAPDAASSGAPSTST